MTFQTPPIDSAKWTCATCGQDVLWYCKCVYPDADALQTQLDTHADQIEDLDACRAMLVWHALSNDRCEAVPNLYDMGVGSVSGMLRRALNELRALRYEGL